MTLSEPSEQRTNRSIEAGLVSAGQRRVNIIWERTQATIALSVVFTALIMSGFIVTSQGSTSDQRAAAILFLVAASNLVIGFYFGRTNHQRTGGVGEAAVTEVSGR